MHSVGKGALLIAGLAIAWAATPATAAGPSRTYTVDLQLVLAVDVSRSMGEDEQLVQRRGYVSAFKSAEVIRAIASGPIGRIAVTYIEWSSANYQYVVVPWTVIADDEDSLLFADALARAPITSDMRTSISSGLAFSANAFQTSGIDSYRRTIDISGDGANNDGPVLAPVRDDLVQQGITINGLPILLAPTVTPGAKGQHVALEEYYEDCVIGGFASFVIPVRSLADFAPAIRRKLVMEIVAVAPEVVPVAERELDRARVDCMMAESNRP